MIKKPLFTFTDDSETGLNTIPVNAPILCDDVDGKPVMFQITDTTGITGATTIATVLAGDNWIAIAPDGLPVGTVLDFAGVTAPDGYLICNGGAISRTTYSDLFAAIGTLWDTCGGASAPAGTLFRIPPSEIGGLGLFTRGSSTATTGTYQDQSYKEHSHTIAHTHIGAAHTHSIAHNHGAVTSGTQSANHTHVGAAHTHSATHNHGSRTSSSDTHNHSVQGSYYGLNTSGSGIVYGIQKNDGNQTSGSDAHNHSVDLPSLSVTTGGRSASTSGSNSVSHTHSVDLPAFTGNSGPRSASTTGGSSAGSSGNSGSTTETKPVSVVMTKIIKY